VILSFGSQADVPAFQVGPNSTVGTIFPGRIVLNDFNNPTNIPPVPCPDMDGFGNATAYTCEDIVRDVTLYEPVLVRKVTSPTNEVFYQTLVGGTCCAFDDNGIMGETAQSENFVLSSEGTGGTGIGSGIKSLDFLGSTFRALDVPTTSTMTGSPQELPPGTGNSMFMGFADTRLDAPALQDIDQQILATSFEDPFDLVSLRISENTNTFGGLFGNGSFDFASKSDSAGNQLSSEVSLVTDFLLNSLGGTVFDVNLGIQVPSKWRADITDKQIFSFRARSVYDINGSQTVTGSRADITQGISFISDTYPKNMDDANVNPNWLPIYGPQGVSGNQASTQAVWDGYDTSFIQIISVTGDMISAPTDGGLGDGVAGLTLGGNTLLWPTGTSGNTKQRLTSTLVGQRIAFRGFLGDVQNNTSQTVTYYDGTGGMTRISQTSGAKPQDLGDDNNGAVWDWDLTFAPIGGTSAPAPAAPSMAPFDPFLTGGIVDPFLDNTIPSCLPSDPNGVNGAC